MLKELVYNSLAVSAPWLAKISTAANVKTIWKEGKMSYHFSLSTLLINRWAPQFCLHRLNTIRIQDNRRKGNYIGYVGHVWHSKRLWHSVLTVVSIVDVIPFRPFQRPRAIVDHCFDSVNLFLLCQEYICKIICFSKEWQKRYHTNTSYRVGLNRKNVNTQLITNNILERLTSHRWFIFSYKGYEKTWPS